MTSTIIIAITAIASSKAGQLHEAQTRDRCETIVGVEHQHAACAVSIVARVGGANKRQCVHRIRGGRMGAEQPFPLKLIVHTGTGSSPHDATI